MCSVGEDVEDEKSKFMEFKPVFNWANSTCVKCKLETPIVVLHNKYPYCKECFLQNTVHKFKAVLGKNRVVHPNENVLIYHKLGHATTALLHMLRSGLNLDTPKRIKFNPIVICIEHHYNLSIEQRKEILDNIKQEVIHFSFPLYFASLYQYILHGNESKDLLKDDCTNLKIDNDDSIQIDAHLKGKCSLTIKKEFLNISETNLLIEIAKHLNCKAIFIPDLGIDTASRLLTSLAMGRGEHIAFDVGAVDARNCDVTILRPLRNFHVKELAFYNILHKIEPVSFLVKNVNPYSSIQTLMDKFINDLQINYPATVTTVVRTGDKLGLLKNLEECKKCLLCKLPLRIMEVPLGSAEATNFSHWASTHTDKSSVSIKNDPLNIFDKFKESDSDDYCYSCSKIKVFYN